MAVLVKVPERVQKVCADIAHHYQEKVAPNGFKGMVVAFDQECCLVYKAALDQLLPPEAIEVVISATGGDERFEPYDRSRDEEERLLDRFRDPNDPLKLLIVTAKLLTGFDAPILQAMYLDKPLRDHTLLQAICRARGQDHRAHPPERPCRGRARQPGDPCPRCRAPRSGDGHSRPEEEGEGVRAQAHRAVEEAHGPLNSVEFLKQLLELARDVVAAERETPVQEDEDRGKAGRAYGYIKQYY